jgi:septum site-determining protein MinC
MPASPPVEKQNRGREKFEIKSAQLPMVALVLKTWDWDALAKDLTSQYAAGGETPNFFEDDPLVLDFSQLRDEALTQNLTPLLAALKKCRLLTLAIRGANPEWTKIASGFGLLEAPPEATRSKASKALVEVSSTPIREIVREIPGPATMVIDRPLRSGQKVYARGADLVVLAMVNQGAEVVADGHIHVYAPLRGKAMAGASGNPHARIFSLCLEPELISIAGVYRTSETPLPADIRGKAAQVRLSDDGQEKLLIEALKS